MNTITMRGVDSSKKRLYTLQCIERCIIDFSNMEDGKKNKKVFIHHGYEIQVYRLKGSWVGVCVNFHPQEELPF